MQKVLVHMCEYSQKSLLTWRNIHIHQHFISHPPFPFLNIGKRKKIGESRSRSRIHVLIILLILKKEIIYLWLGCIKEKVHWSIVFQLTFFEKETLLWETVNRWNGSGQPQNKYWAKNLKLDLFKAFVLNFKTSNQL